MQAVLAAIASAPVREGCEKTRESHSDIFNNPVREASPAKARPRCQCVETPLRQKLKERPIAEALLGSSYPYHRYLHLAGARLFAAGSAPDEPALAGRPARDCPDGQRHRDATRGRRSF